MFSTGKIIAAERVKNGFSREQLAERVGIVTETLARYERGDRIPKKATIQKLAIILGVSEDYLMGKESYGLSPDKRASLGSRLRQLRERRGLSAAEAAAQMGAGEEEYARYEAGEAEPPRRELELYASGLDASVAWLLDGAGEPDEPGDPTLETARAAIERCETVRRTAALMGSLPEARQEEILQLVRDRALLEKLRRQNEGEGDPEEGIL